MKKYYLILLLLVAFGLNLSAQVHINEFSASNLEGFFDSFGRTEDWIELYNESSDPVDLSGWHLPTRKTIQQSGQFLMA